jgi:uncharacterized protein
MGGARSRGLALAGSLAVLLGAAGCGSESQTKFESVGSAIDGESVSLGGGAGGGGGGEQGDAIGAASSDAASSDDVATGPGVADPTAPGSVDLVHQGPLAGSGRKIISTAELTVEVADVGEATAKAVARAEAKGAILFGQNSSLAEVPTATLTFKVPPDEFAALRADLSELGELRAEEVRTDDVTEQVVDLEGRIATAQASVERMRALMGEAANVMDLAALESDLLRRETELETLEGQLRTLEDKVDLATVVLVLHGEAGLDPDIAATTGVQSIDEDRPSFTEGFDAGWEAFLDTGSATLAALRSASPSAAGAAGGATAHQRRRPRHRRPPPPRPAESPFAVTGGCYGRLMAMPGDPDAPVGRVLGTEDATPLEFWVGVAPERYLQLDDVVALERHLPGHADPVEIYGMVAQVRARHEGAQFDSDVFLIADGRLPADTSEAALVQATRFEPEIFVPPLPGTEVRKATGKERERALFVDVMERPLAAGLSRDGEPVLVDLDFLDGTKGAHVNISGVSGVATKTSYATFLLYSLFHSGQLGVERANTKALIFNVKGEDLLFLDQLNQHLSPEQADRYRALDLPVGAFQQVSVLVPPVPGDANASPQVSSRATGVRSFYWTLQEFCRDGLLPFLFADAEDDRQQYTMVVHNVTQRLREATPIGDAAVKVVDRTCRTFEELVDQIQALVQDEDTMVEWAGRAISVGTVNAFVRRLWGAVDSVSHLLRGDVARTDGQALSFDGAQLTVVDLHNLRERAQRFVVGVVLRTAFQNKERSGRARPLQFVVLDELNKYAPREGSSPIKEILLDVAERGRSLGIILIGAQQTASEVERRIVANSALRVVGRLDAAEAGRPEYGFLPTVQRQRATIIKPGTMIVSQPQLPVPIVLEFPFPSWATRPAEAAGAFGVERRGDAAGHASPGPPDDPFDGL